MDIRYLLLDSAGLTLAFLMANPASDADGPPHPLSP